MMPAPANVTVGITLGAVAALLFIVADLYVILHMVQTIFAPKSTWPWLRNLAKRWHRVHYYGNISLVIVMVIHTIIMAPYATFWNWLFFAVVVLMGCAGVTLRFSHVSLQAKATIARFHARWYMILIVLVLLVISHLVSLSSFPYLLG